MFKKHVKKRNRPSQYTYFIIIILAVILIIITENSESPPKGKLLIIFAEALPSYIVNPNIDEFPAIKQLCEDGFCGSLRPSPPTFTTVQDYVLQTGLKPKDAAFVYNFVINQNEFSKGICKFDGEKGFLGFRHQKQLWQIIAQQGNNVIQFPADRNLSDADKAFGKLPQLLKSHEVVRTYVLDTDSHYTNLSDISSESEIVQRFKTFDKKLGDLFDELKSENLYDNTTIILYGDHGMAAIDKFYYMPDVLSELRENSVLNDVCIWNDAGTSARFWIMANDTSKKEAIKKDINAHFSKNEDCFYTINDDFLRESGLYIEDDERRWINYGDVHIGVNVGCKMNTVQPSGGMEAGFAEKQNEVDKYISMHGYLDNFDYRMLAFLAIKQVRGEKKTTKFELDSTFIELRNFILDEVNKDE